MKIILAPKKQFLFFIVLFFIVNLLQSYFTQLLHDEAYYWVWSKHLSFGYYDHPPLVALWIKISSLFFNGELGVRFFSTISFSFTLFFIWKCIDDYRKQQYVWLYFLLIVSTALLNVYGFIAVPDTPLLFFTAVFLYTYKRLLEVNTLVYAFLMGFAMSGMLYSKYHGILVILLIIISNVSLLKNKRFWVACVFGTFLYIPHILWQIEYGFSTIKFHLFERGYKEQYRYDAVIMHIVNLIIIIGLPFPIIYWAFFKQKISSIFEKGLKYIVVGFIIFFFLATFKFIPQPQWAVIIILPIIILTFKFFINKKKSRNWLIYLGLSNLVVMLFARVFMANSELSPLKFETHIGQQWADSVKLKTKGKPIVFITSYQKASKYKFYTGIETHSFSALNFRESQYDLFNTEEKLQHKKVTIEGYKIEGYSLHGKGNSLHYGYDVYNYTTCQKAKCMIEEDKIILRPNEKHNFLFKIHNPYNYEIAFNEVTFLGIFQGKKNVILKEVPIKIDTNFLIPQKSEKTVSASFIVPKEIDSTFLYFRIGLKFYQFPPGFQGNKTLVVIKND